MRYGTLPETRPAPAVTVPKTAGGWRPAPGEPGVLDDGTRAHLHAKGPKAAPERGRSGA